MVSNKELLERIDALESKQRGTAKAVKNVEDIQAGIGLNALVYQRIRNYVLAAFLGIFGIAYIIYISTHNEMTKHQKEMGYVVGGVSLALAVLIVLLFRWYSGFVTKNKRAQVFNAFLIETQMLAGRNRNNNFFQVI